MTSVAVILPYRTITLVCVNSCREALEVRVNIFMAKRALKVNRGIHRANKGRLILDTPATYSAQFIYLRFHTCLIGTL